MNSPQELRNYIELIATQHKLIERFYYADYDDIIGSERNTIDYPLLWMESPEVNPRNEDHYNIEYAFSFMILMAAPLDDRPRQLSNSHVTFGIAQSIIARLRKDEDSDDTFNFSVDDVNLEEVSAAVGNNNEGGWRVSLRMYSYVEHCYDNDDWYGVPLNYDFVGTLTIGQLAGEGGITAYGYKEDEDDDFGALPNFYTYYDRAGLYWVEGFLYVWGVDVEFMQIDDEEFTDGTVENGYTVFECANPLTGITARISITGVSLEIWDYEGVMTVGYTNLIFGLFTVLNVKYGALPGYTGNMMLWTGGDFMTRDDGIYKIDDIFIKNLTASGNLSDKRYSKAVANPFPLAGETCEIKIKL